MISLSIEMPDMKQNGWIKYHCSLGNHTEIYDISEVLCHKKTKYQEITVIRRSYDNAKMLFIDGQEQSDSMYADAFNYTLTVPVRSDMKDVLILGSGAGGPAKFLLGNSDFKGKITQIDIDVEMMHIAKEHLYEWHEDSFDDPRITNIFADVQNYIEVCQPYDMIINDLTDNLTVSKSCWTKEFFEKVISKIKPGGVFSSHLCYISDDHKDRLELFPLDKFFYWDIKPNEKALWKFFQGSICTNLLFGG